MICKHCFTEMDPTGLIFANGWKCPKCNHQEVDVVSAKMGDMEYFKAYMRWNCGCKCCKSHQKRGAKNVFNKNF